MTLARALQTAVAEGVIDAGQAGRITEIAAGLPAAERTAAAGDSDAALPRDPENLRFVRGFADIFVTIGIALVIGAAIHLSDRVFEPTWVAATTAGIAWLLAEYFTRVRRMALPSIVLLLLFATSAAVVFVNLVPSLFGQAQLVNSFGEIPVLWLAHGLDGSSTAGDAIPVALAALATALAVGLHYLRFRVPIAVMAAVAALVGMALFSLHIAAPTFEETYRNWVLLACGGVVFALAMWFDMGDPQRLTRRTDIAFWLHLLAAPLIVHPILSTVLGTGRSAFTPIEPVAPGAASGGLRDNGLMDPQNAVLMLALFAAIALVSVLIDRRSFLVAGLAYAGFAFVTLLTGSAGDLATPLSVLMVGALILLLSAGWPFLRRLMLGVLPTGLTRRLPPVLQQSGSRT